MDAAHSFRILLKNYLTPKKTQKGKTETLIVEKPTEGTIWVAKTYPPWQSTILTMMKNLYLVSNNFIYNDSDYIHKRINYIYIYILIYLFIAYRKMTIIYQKIKL